jgi:hypothetical protein
LLARGKRRKDVLFMATNTTNSPIDSAQINTEVTAGIASADSTAAQRVQNLQWVHQARASQLSRTASTLKAQYGADDPGVKAAEAAATAATTNAARVGMVHQQLATTDPQVAAKGWVLHGRVFDAHLQPVSGFTVFLVDATKAYQQAYGFAYTDDSGYFLLNYSGPAAASQDKSQAGAPAAQVQLFIEVANTKALPVFVSTTAFQPVEGAATYQNITLPDGNQAIGDPPPEIRATALPPQKKKRKA